MSSAAPVISIPVDDSGFQRFVNSFNQYRTDLSQTTHAWLQMNDAAMQQRNTFSQQLEIQQRQHEHELKLLESQTALGRETKKTAGYWERVAKAIGKTDLHITSITRSILSWGSLTALGTGLLGFGGLFGLAGLAHGVANERRTAMGLGVSIGELSGFRSSFSRLIDPDAYLGWMNEMETDITKQGAAYGLMGHGLSGSTGKDSIEMLKAIRGLAKSTSLEQLGPILQAYGLHLSTEEQRRLHGDVTRGGMSDQEFAELIAKYEKQKGSAAISEKSARAWQELTTQLEQAKQKIFATFVQGLKPLEGPLGRLSEGFANLVKQFLKAPIVQEGIDALASGLNWLARKFNNGDAAKWLESGLKNAEVFATKTKHFFELVEQAYDKAEGWLSWYTGVPKDSEKNPWTGTKTSPSEYLVNGIWGAGADMVGHIWDQVHRWTGGAQKLTGSQIKERVAAVANDYALPNGMLSYLVQHDQQMKHPGVDSGDVIEADAKRLKSLARRYAGDMAKALAAYNMGPTAVDEVIAAHPGDWRKHISKETQGYIAGATRIEVHVYAHPGTNVSHGVAQMRGAQ